MNKYVYSESTQDYWPQIKTTSAKSYNDCVEKIILQYGNELEDDKIIDTIDDWNQLREYLNDNYYIALSDLEDIDEL